MNLVGMYPIFWEALRDSRDLITRPTKFISLWTCCLFSNNKFISYRVLFLFLLINIFSDSCWDQDYLMCFQSTPLKKTWDLISSGLLAPILWSESQQNLKMYTKILICKTLKILTHIKINIYSKRFVKKFKA